MKQKIKNNKINKTKSQFFEIINKTDKTLVKTMTKKKKTQIIKVRNKIGDSVTKPTEENKEGKRILSITNCTSNKITQMKPRNPSPEYMWKYTLSIQQRGKKQQ